MLRKRRIGCLKYDVEDTEYCENLVFTKYMTLESEYVITVP